MELNHAASRAAKRTLIVSSLPALGGPSVQACRAGWLFVPGSVEAPEGSCRVSLWASTRSGLGEVTGVRRRDPVGASGQHDALGTFAAELLQDIQPGLLGVEADAAGSPPPALVQRGVPTDSPALPTWCAGRARTKAGPASRARPGARHGHHHRVEPRLRDVAVPVAVEARREVLTCRVARNRYVGGGGGRCAGLSGFIAVEGCRFAIVGLSGRHPAALRPVRGLPRPNSPR